MQAQLSVVIPAYNAARTLERAAQSALGQNVREMELIVIDDGSRDATPAICHALAARDARVQIITRRNAGICAARNLGLDAAGGEFVAFCDDDDEFLPNALPHLLRTARETHADIVRGGYEILRAQKGGGYTALPHPAGRSCRFAAGQGGYGAYLQSSGPQFVWNALYRRETLSGLRFDERCRSGLEDFIFNAAAYARIGSAVYVPQVVYRHYESEQSTSLDQTVPALKSRIRMLAPWIQAEMSAAERFCTGQELTRVKNDRITQAITFLMHQLHTADAPAALRRYAWRTLRQTTADCQSTPFAALLGTSGGTKSTAALLLYTMHLQNLYELWSNHEEPL